MTSRTYLALACTVPLLAVVATTPGAAAAPTAPGPGRALTADIAAGTTVLHSPPVRTLTGRQLFSPRDVAVLHGQTYVKSTGLTQDLDRTARSRIVVYGKGARGDARPERVITGPKVGWWWKGDGIAVDRRGRIITTTMLRLADGRRHNVIAVFGRKADGNVAPVRVITDAMFAAYAYGPGALDRPYFSGAITVGRDGTLYAGTDGPGQDDDGVAVFAPGASGDAAPTRWIRGPQTGVHNPRSLELDRAGNLWVTAAADRLLRFPAGADGDVAPDRRIGPPASAGVLRPLLCGVDRAGNVYVVNQRRAPGHPAQVAVFGPKADGADQPRVRLTGPATELAASRGCAVDAQRRVTVSLHFESTVTTYAPLVRTR